MTCHNILQKIFYGGRATRCLKSDNIGKILNVILKVNSFNLCIYCRGFVSGHSGDKFPTRSWPTCACAPLWRCKVKNVKSTGMHFANLPNSRVTFLCDAHENGPLIGTRCHVTLANKISVTSPKQSYECPTIVKLFCANIFSSHGHLHKHLSLCSCDFSIHSPTRTMGMLEKENWKVTLCRLENLWKTMGLNFRFHTYAKSATCKKLGKY